MEGTYCLTFKCLTTECTFDYASTHKRTNLPNRCVQAMALFAAKQDDYCHNYSVTGYTACKLLIHGRQEIFRAVSSFMDDGHWYDWCLVQWEVNGVHKPSLGESLVSSTLTTLDHVTTCWNPFMLLLNLHVMRFPWILCH